MSQRSGPQIIGVVELLRELGQMGFGLLGVSANGILYVYICVNILDLMTFLPRQYFCSLRL